MPDVISQSNKETTSKSQSKNARSCSSGRRSSTNGEPNTAAAVTATPKLGKAVKTIYMSGNGLTVWRTYKNVTFAVLYKYTEFRML